MRFAPKFASLCCAGAFMYALSALAADGSPAAPSQPAEPSSPVVAADTSQTEPSRGAESSRGAETSPGDPPTNEIVHLSIDDCETASGVEIAKLVSLEIAPYATVVFDDSVRATIHATLRCAVMRAVITVQDSRRKAPLTLHLELVDTHTPARPRFLALAVAELIATSRLERAAVQTSNAAPPATRREPTRPEPPTAVPARPSEHASAVWLGVGALRGYEPSAWSPAVLAGAQHAFVTAGVVALDGDVAFDWSTRGDAGATVKTRTISLRVTPTLRLLSSPLTWDVGAGVRAGYTHLSAEPRDGALLGRPVAGAFWAPVLHTAQHLPFAGSFFVRWGLELGYVLTPVRGLDADGRPLIEQRGVRAAGALGVGMML